VSMLGRIDAKEHDGTHGDCAFCRIVEKSREARVNSIQPQQRHLRAAAELRRVIVTAISNQMRARPERDDLVAFISGEHADGLMVHAFAEFEDALLRHYPTEQILASRRPGQEHHAKCDRKDDDMHPICSWKAVPGDKVHHPSHYGGADNVYEHIKVMRAWNLDYELGNATKYIARVAVGGKGTDPVEDLKKAAWYVLAELQRRGCVNVDEAMGALSAVTPKLTET
jgi:hypothetical protein